jgi:hypothetical protein
MMRVAPRPLLVVIRSGPVAGEQRQKGDLVDHVSQQLVAGEAEVDLGSPALISLSRARSAFSCSTLAT